MSPAGAEAVRGVGMALPASLPASFEDGETPGYLRRQLITCLGNKRLLLPAILARVERAKARLGKSRLRMLDAFCGSGAVARAFKRHASELTCVDQEDYAVAAARSHLANRETLDPGALAERVRDLNARADADPGPAGFIEELYAPRDDGAIAPGDRVFYTRRNARRLDFFRRELDGLDSRARTALLGPLLSAASIRANTSGVFKGFHKDRRTGLGRFGGTRGDALSRILGDVVLEPPLLSAYSCPVRVWRGDANVLAPRAKGLDLAYLDPPYNQHPYGSNYFMLNLLATYRRPEAVSRVAGIPVDWRRSDYNVRERSAARLGALVESLDAKFLLVSFNDEGFVSLEAMLELLGRTGRVEVVEAAYPTFRGCRNLGARPARVTERLFWVER